MLGRAPRTFSRSSPKRPHQWRTAWQHLPLFPKPGNVTHAKCERAKRCHRSGNVPKIVRRALSNEAEELQVRVTQLQNAFYRLTPELSRPVAGRRTRASVAQKHVADATTWGRLERIVRRHPASQKPRHVLQRVHAYQTQSISHLQGSKKRKP